MKGGKARKLKKKMARYRRRREHKNWLLMKR
jgi:hypothetical protein